MNKRSIYRVLWALPLLFAFDASSVSAQSVDYNGLSELYGQPVTTSANGSPQKQSEVALNMEIITAEEIERAGARSIPEILRFIPGLSVQQLFFGNTEVSVRGYNQALSERILVLVNGRQVYTDFFGQVIWDNIPVEISEIVQIEVVKGPNTALFGFNAVSGVINIITVNPLHDDLKVAEVRAGSHSLNEGSAVITHKASDDVAFKISAGGYHANRPFGDASDATADGSARGSIAVDLWGQVTDKIQTQLEITHNRNQRNEYTALTEGQAQFDTSSIRGRVIADTSYGKIEAEIYHNETQEDVELLTSEELGTTSDLEIDNRITVAKLNNTFTMGPNHTFRVGGEYRNASNIFTAFDADDLTYQIYSGSFLWDWRVNSRLRTSASVRYDNFRLEPDSRSNIQTTIPGANGFTDYTQKREEFSYNFGAVYDLSEIETLRANISRGADLPSFTEFGLQFFVPPSGSNPDGLAVLGNPNVDTSIINNFEIGYDREIEEINGLFRSAMFYQHNNEMQGFAAQLETISGFAPFGGADLDREILSNIGDSEMYGIELGLEGRHKQKWDWFLNYAFINIDDDFRNQQTSAEFSSSNEYENSSVQHTVNAHVGYKEDKWRADLFAQYTASAEALDSLVSQNGAYELVDINDNLIVNANFAYDLTDQITWSISGSNIIGDTQQSPHSDAERIVWSTLRFKF